MFLSVFISKRGFFDGHYGSIGGEWYGADNFCTGSQSRIQYLPRRVIDDTVVVGL